MMRSACVLFVCFGVACGDRSTAASDDRPAVSRDEAEFFESRIRPVLVVHCLKCHGAKKQESGLRLDSRAMLLKGGDRGAAVKRGDPDGSLLIRAIRRDGDLKMPPSKQLNPKAVAALTRWVKLSLPWPQSTTPRDSADDTGKQHWAYQPVRTRNVPDVKDSSSARSPIDRFILEKLEAHGLRPSIRADRKTLIRRVTFDLTGMPPTPEDVADFGSDISPNAFTKVVDRLLASPHYGERWGRHWLDVARYADNKGYVFFEEKKFPWAYTYRDYVIRAFNQDLPYDQFVLHQLAADQLPLGDDKWPLAAMGFLTLGARFMNNLHDVIDDRIDVVTRGLMGLTVTCARCHDHKYDPIPQEDYYSLYGVFHSSHEPALPPLFSSPPDTGIYRKFEKEMSARLKKLVDFVNTKHTELVVSARSRVGEYLMAAYARRGQPPTDDFMLLTFKGQLNPTMILRWQIYLERSQEDYDPVWEPWNSFAALEEEQFAEKASVLVSQWNAKTDPERGINPLVLKAFTAKPPRSMKDVAQRYDELLKRVDRRWQSLLKQAAARKQSMPRQFANPNDEELRQVFYGPQAPPNVPVSFGWGFLALFPDRPTQGEYKKLIKDVETWSMTGAGAPARAMVLVDSDTPYNPRVFLRGNPHRLGRHVPRRFPAVLSKRRQPFKTGSGRRELAESIIDPRNPLTARVMVNRIWMHHFGSGLVTTPSDFGLRSERPSHPELLDYLATAFVHSGWSIKALHRSILLSTVYQQRSDDREECRRLDPENRLLWKMNRRRLDFEAIRDSLVAVSGDLDCSIGGKPVDLLQKGFVPRRSVYGFIDRMDMPGLLRAFDFPSPAATSPQRDTTTIAPQALFLMNNDFVVEAARRLAHRADVAALKSKQDRVHRIYRILFGRTATEDELNLARKFLDEVPADQHWPQFIHALLMTNEFVFAD